MAFTKTITLADGKVGHYLRVSNIVLNTLSLRMRVDVSLYASKDAATSMPTQPMVTVYKQFFYTVTANQLKSGSIVDLANSLIISNKSLDGAVYVQDTAAQTNTKP